jgi:hypothetical protein
MNTPSSPAAAAFALAKRHGVEVTLRGDGLVLRSRGEIQPDVLASLRQAKPDMLAALRRDSTGDELLEALRARGFVISRYGQDDGTMPPLPDVVAKHDAFFRRLLAWKVPDQGVATARPEPQINCDKKRS